MIEAVAQVSIMLGSPCRSNSGTPGVRYRECRDVTVGPKGISEKTQVRVGDGLGPDFAPFVTEDLCLREHCDLGEWVRPMWTS